MFTTFQLPVKINDLTNKPVILILNAVLLCVETIFDNFIHVLFEL